MRAVTQSAIQIFSFSVIPAIGACGGGSSNSTPCTVPPPPPPAPPPPPVVNLDPEYRASSTSPLTTNCEGISLSATVFLNSEVEPHFAVDPSNPLRYFGAWQQERWTSGGARGLGVGVSRDGGHSWSRSFPPFSDAPVAMQETGATKNAAAIRGTPFLRTEPPMSSQLGSTVHR